MGTIFASQITAATGHGYRDPIARGGKLLHRQRHDGIRHIDSHADMVVVEPMCRDGRRNLGFVLVIAREHANFSAEDFSAKIFDGHVSGHDRTFSGKGCENTGHVGQHADIDARFTCQLRARRQRPYSGRTSDQFYDFAASQRLSPRRIRQILFETW